jgi:MbtH protein
MSKLVKREEQEDKLQYYVVKNIEDQYSIWPTYKTIPKGWEKIGESRNKADCLEYINKVWTDMRPLSLRKQMEELGENKNLNILEGEFKKVKTKNKMSKSK